MSEMTKGERDELARLVRMRARVAKDQATTRGAEMLAEFEAQVATDYHLNDQEVWKEAASVVAAAIEHANARISERCRELGIRDEFAPSIRSGWIERGEHSSRRRVEELRKVARSRIAAREKAAKAAIEAHSVEIQTKLVASGLQSGEARAFLEAMPTPAALMPSLTVDEIEAGA